MKKNELKQVLKPLIKECIKECIFEEGVLSGIVTEVAKGLSGNIMEAKISHNNTSNDQQKLEEEYEKERQKRIKKLNDSALQKVGIDIFEGTSPTLPDPAAGSALSGMSPSDPGVDIDGIVNLSRGKWKHLIK